MSVFTINGSAVLAMKGNDCVSIASDLRFGINRHTVMTDFPKTFEMGPGLFVGLAGLATDIQTVQQKLNFRMKMFELREGRKMRPNTFSTMLSHLLYERRFGPFFVNPIVAGYDYVENKPFISSMDLIGAITIPEDFVAAGTSEDSLMGMCEALWFENMNPEELFEATSQAIMNSFDRDSLAGWGAEVHIIEKHQVTTRRIKTRMD
ncbi:proteasome subunit beta type-3 [Lepeophtheirus salmonis]|uniref:Proteasome subunit beta n=2 Tax=Lepeophtheirus salmonis TaxID=72036 RepID=C1BUY9_LEPSM|nr:proteasome subunit beta type-3-like [Lepeophtheirus salmonis]ACO12842.1 Proteasome subunit beta type-3 [Lepeophtheirus salmonis]ADD24577.1 Proteasome subunit beta type-3 [Lepeophtheirus salmonis]